MQRIITGIAGLLAAAAASQNPTATAVARRQTVSPPVSAPPIPTALTDCHTHGSTQYVLGVRWASSSDTDRRIPDP